MLPFKKIRASLYKQARDFANKNPEFSKNELLAVAWLGCIDVKEPKLVSKKAKWSIQNFLRKERIFKKRHMELTEELQLHLVAPCVFNEEPLDLNELIRRASLSEKEKVVLYARFYQSQMLSDIGLTHGLTKQRVSQIIQEALRKIRRVI